ncbi:MAG TPA: hypothetical protein VFS34_04155 [Thermoanaerobaculia bacterium]|nr:hypothetical protein [Thermoanaerobaculia bacterium]
MVGFEMLVTGVAGVRWSIPLLLAPPAAFGIASLAGGRSRLAPYRSRPAAAWLASAAVFLLLVAYAAATARATSPDLVLFWGAKGERFALARGIDVAFLARPANYLMHPDYPPLLPFVEAFATMFAGRFAWGASLFLMPWFLGITGAIFHAAALRRLENARAAAALTAIFVGTLGLADLVSATAGSADGLLVAFETAALASLSAIGSRRLSEWTAGLCLAAAGLAKIEGVFFAAIVAFAAVALTRSSWRSRATSAWHLATAPALAFGTWLLFCRAHRLVAMYRADVFGAPTLRFLPRILSVMGRTASYDHAYVPWLALAASAWAFRRFGFAAVPVAAAGLFLAADVGFYLNGNSDPSMWVGWSSARTLTTVLACGFLSIGRTAIAGESRIMA